MTQKYGGKRKGAGRPAKLSYENRLWIGCECEQLHRNVCTDLLDTEISTQSPNYNKELEKALAIPIKERSAWLKSFASQEHLDNVDFAIKEDRGVNATDQSPSPIRHVSIKRPKGHRSKIIDEVRKIAIARYHLELSSSTVDRCWKEFRSLEKSIRSDD